MEATQTAPAPMCPGNYLRLRRTAAGLTIADVAARLAEEGEDPAELALSIENIERHDVDDMRAQRHLTLLDRLRGAFAFDQRVYTSLVAVISNPKRPITPICVGCACSWADPCLEQVGDELRPCSWGTKGEEPPVCSSCLERDLEQSGMVIAVADVDGDECPDCGGELGPVFGVTKSRTCGTCDTTFLGAGEEGARNAA